MADFVLIHSPLVGASSLSPTASALRAMGFRCHTPSPVRNRGDSPPWRDWPRLLFEQLPDLISPVIVGHSGGGLLAAHLAGLLNARGLVCLDAMIPPASGLVPPVEPSFLDFVRSLPVADGRLPVWSRWWGGDILASAPVDPEAKASLAADMPALRPDWFDDAFEMADWSGCLKFFVRLSPAYEGDARRAAASGWTVSRLDGTHLHPAFRPDETAAELRRIVGKI